MKTLFKIIILNAILYQGCGINEDKPNHFLSSSDTLFLRTEKHKGDGLFSLGVMPSEFQDSSEKFANAVIYPNEITNIKRMQIPIDFRAREIQYIDIINGRINDEEIFIVDENNNKNLTDDSVRTYKPIKWRSNENLIKCKYLISNGQQIIQDSSWIRIGTMYNDLWWGRSEHLIASFTMNKEKYKVGIIDSRLAGFFYGIYPEMAILSHNAEIKDTLFQKDILKSGEFLNLDGNYYRFANITNNGEYITLTKENDFNKEIGLQVGMIAPGFTCITVTGDTLRSSTMHDRILVIANSCGCGGDQLSTEAYYDMKREYAGWIHILRLDSKIDKGLEGLQIDVDEKFNEDIYNKYRNEYCSRICYVIDKNNRVIDKFPVSNWKSNFPKYIAL